MFKILKHYVKEVNSVEATNYEKLSYRDKLLELAYIYNVKEIQDYTKEKTLTTGQIELILKKIRLSFQKILNLVFLEIILLNQFKN